MLRSAYGAKPPENELAFAHSSLAQRSRSWFGHVVPLNVFDVAALIADEVVMMHAVGIKACSAALNSHFPD